METNAVDVSQSFYNFGSDIATSISDYFSFISSGWSDSFEVFYILEFLLAVLGGFIVIVGFWIVAKHLFRAARATR